jgi:hypothetical protein
MNKKTKQISIRLKILALEMRVNSDMLRECKYLDKADDMEWAAEILENWVKEIQK